MAKRPLAAPWLRLASAPALVGVLVSLGCASQKTPPRTATTYPGTCELLAIEQVKGPSVSQHDGDTAFLMATYRFSDGGVESSASPWSLTFRTERSRARELQAHLEHHPRVVCRPKRGGSGAGYEIEVPVFEGQRGEPGVTVIGGAAH